MNKLKEKPFAMIGVNGFHDSPAKLKKVMTSEKITWRTFAAKGEIAEQWNYPATPSFYVIGPTGVIQRKWVGTPGHNTIDAVLEEMIKEVEASSSSK